MAKITTPAGELDDAATYDTLTLAHGPQSADPKTGNPRGSQRVLQAVTVREFASSPTCPFCGQDTIPVETRCEAVTSDGKVIGFRPEDVLAAEVKVIVAEPI